MTTYVMIEIVCQPADVEVGRLVEEAEKLRQLNHHDAPAIMRQVSAMEVRWQRFLSRMEDHRAMLEASIEYHQLYEQVNLLPRQNDSHLLHVLFHLSFWPQLFKRSPPDKSL